MQTAFAYNSFIWNIIIVKSIDYCQICKPINFVRRKNFLKIKRCFFIFSQDHKNVREDVPKYYTILIVFFYLILNNLITFFTTENLVLIIVMITWNGNVILFFTFKFYRMKHNTRMKNAPPPPADNCYSQTVVLSWTLNEALSSFVGRS